MTIDVYGHVLLDEPEWRLRELREAVGRMTGLGDGGDSAARSVRVQADEPEPENDEAPLGERGFEDSGGYRARTGDLYAASVALSQLS